MTKILEVINLNQTLGGRNILKDISFDFYRGESLAILGGSGSGKSVLLKTILGLLPGYKGQIILRDNANKLPNYGMLFQASALFDSLTVWENVAFKLLYKQNISRNKARDIAAEHLLKVQLSPEQVIDLYPVELSGGMQKRVALARAIASKPEILFLDEPTTGLDPIVSSHINTLIQELRKELGASTFTITHDTRNIKKIAQRFILLKDATIIWQGTIQDLEHCQDEYVKQFLGLYS